MDTLERDQLELDLPLEDLKYVPPQGDTIQERFERFHALNPWLYEVLEGRIADRIAAGKARVGVKHIIEDYRWNGGSMVSVGESFEDKFTSRYARLLVEKHPEWDDAIETRPLHSP